MKGYKLWDPISKKTIYSQDVVFREVDGTSYSEEVPTKKEP
jgi:hypothetical protein